MEFSSGLINGYTYLEIKYPLIKRENMIIKRWVLHAIVQNMIAILPNKFSYKLYFFLQRNLGGLKFIAEVHQYLWYTTQIYMRVKKYHINSDTFFELGTGRTLVMQIGFWILGVKRQITVDLNPYLDEKSTKQIIKNIIDKNDEYYFLFKDYISKEKYYTCINELDRLLNMDLKQIMSSLNIEYRPNWDARDLNFILDDKIDVYYSNQVLEHIPEEVLEIIIQESRRVLKKNGLSVHYIGPHDHFAGIDKTITRVNYLKFGDSVWNLIAGNKFMYHNRLISLDYDRLFSKNRFEQVEVKKDVDELSLKVLNNGFKVNKKFNKYNNEELAVRAIMHCDKPIK